MLGAYWQQTDLPIDPQAGTIDAKVGHPHPFQQFPVGRIHEDPMCVLEVAGVVEFLGSVGQLLDSPDSRRDAAIPFRWIPACEVIVGPERGAGVHLTPLTL